MFPIRRRHFLRTAIAALGSLSVAGAAGALFGPGFRRKPFERRRSDVPGSILGASARTGHLLRGGSFPAPTESLETGVAIIGGGISGLSSAWALDRLGFGDYALLELESETGGNSRSGRNAVSAYPWAAHYVPLPNAEASLVSELFEELGIITGYHPVSGLPEYDEFFLCADPHERLLINGSWQEGLVPTTGLTEHERADARRFFSQMDVFREARGRDGRPAFAIPIAKSSSDFRHLDRLSMAAWLDREGFTSAPLRWYVNYCCRDDYGCETKDVSAWAGIHYFASRRGRAANADPSTVLTWPEGNAFIAGKLREKAGSRVRTGSLVFNVENVPGGVVVDSFEPSTGKTTRVGARAAVFAAPRFTATHVVRGVRPSPSFTYAPWMVANVTVSSVPRGPGAEPAWDNVSYHSPSLGYITATHQNLTLLPGRSVLTYYLPLSGEDPAPARRGALSRSHTEWASMIAADLERMHPGVTGEIERIDVWLWGHGMIRPLPGFIWGAERRESMRSHGKVFFAHSDMSGISIFEEAQYQGVRAAHEAFASLRSRG